MHLHFIYYERDIRCWPRCFFSRFLHLKKYCWVDKNLYWSKRWVNLAEHMQVTQGVCSDMKIKKEKKNFNHNFRAEELKLQYNLASG